MFALDPSKYETPLATRWGVFKPGKEADLSKVPYNVKTAWLKDGIFVQNDKAPDLFEDMPPDGLSELDRDQLKLLAVRNKLPLKVKVGWSDEQIRQAIRDLVDPSELELMLEKRLADLALAKTTEPAPPAVPAQTSPAS